MIRHYLFTAFSRIVRTPFTTAANILTLGLGLACFIAAYGIVVYWSSADTHHANADRTVVIGQDLSNPNNAAPGTPTTGSSPAISLALREDFPEFEHVVRSYGRSDVSVVAGDNRLLTTGLFAESAFLELFDLDFMAGNRRTALSAPNSLVLTQAAAQRLFGDAPVMGQSVVIAGEISATVTGVIGPIRQPSFMDDGVSPDTGLGLIGPWNLLPDGQTMDDGNQWFATQVMTYGLLSPGASIDAVNARFPEFVERRMPTEQKLSAKMTLSAFPVSEITTRDLDMILFSSSGHGLSTIGVLLGFGALTLVIAAINYTNLATAQATQLHKDIGMRKVLGAGRRQIIAQSWLNTLLQACLALVLALVILVAIRPVILNAGQVDTLFFFSTGPGAFAVIAAIVVAVAIVAGAYPALVLSGIRPIRALASGKSRSDPKLVARLLVGIQFAAASLLLIMLTVGVEQRAYFERNALGVHDDPIVVLGNINQNGVSYDALENALSGAPGVVSITPGDRPPWAGGATTFFVSHTPDEGAAYLQTLTKHVGHDYFETLSLGLQAGRTFQRDRETEPRTLSAYDSSAPMPVIIDRLLSDNLGFASPEAAIDQVVYLPVSFMRFVGRSVAQPIQIIGVVDEDMMRVDSRGTAGYLYVFGPNSPSTGAIFPVIRLDRRNLSAGLEAIDRAWNELSPNTAIGVEFFDDLFQQAYSQYQRVGQMFILLACAAFLIASIGLLGIAVHAASRRRHEIAVRKTLGSSVAGIVRLLLTDFSIPVLIGNLLAWPVGYLAAQTYLSAFAHRIDLTLAPFALSLGITLVIAWAAIIGVVLKAASVRPAEVLRHA